MNMKSVSVLFLTTLFSFSAFSQATSQQADKEAIIKVIRQLFDGMRKGDSSMVRSVFTESPSLYTITGKPALTSDNLQEFLEAVGTPHKEVWDERVWTYEITIDGNLANAWTPYAFFVDTTFSHCGVDNFQLYKGGSGWKIFSLSDTRRRSDCTSDPAMAVNIAMDRWHKAAATADEDAFFGAMTEDGIYVGTDAAERWGRDEMRVWSKQFFDRESAWDFTPLSRQVYLSDDGQLAWFEENLDTWMGPVTAPAY